MRSQNSFRLLLGAVAALLSVAPGAKAQTAPTNTQLLDQLLAKAKPGAKFVKNDDMLLSVEKLRAYRGSVRPATRQAASAFYQTTLWPEGNVYYVFDVSLLPEQRTAFVEAAREWETIARLKFTPRTTQADYIRVYRDPSEGSFSAIGKIGGVQDMSLANWASKYTAAHEIAHALGVMHEQSRSNRDNYVSIDFTNIETDKADNFAIVTNSNNRGAYDFDSVMHYSQDAFAIDPSKPTITTKAGYTQFQQRMGQRGRISEADKKGMAEIYGPPLSTLPPLNDRFANAQVIEGLTGSATGTNKLATVETGEAAATKQNATATIWYRWRPTVSGPVTITTKGSAIDTTLGVYLGDSVTTVTPVAFNDDAVVGASSPATGLTSSVTFPAQIGANYSIAIDSFSDFLSAGLTGAVTLTWSQRSDSARFRVSGSVKTLAAPGQGLSDVTIRMTGADASNSAATGTATTNASGEYAIANMPTGNYNLTASRPGYIFSPAPLRLMVARDSGGNNFTASATPLSELPELFVSDVSTREGNRGSSFLTFNISLSAPSADKVTVNWETADGTASSVSDYRTGKGTLTFAPGVTTIAVNIGLRPDAIIEPNESFALRISNVTGARIVKDSGLGTILNDDNAAADVSDSNS